MIKLYILKSRFRLNSLRRDKKGATLVEFALIAPTFLLMLMGTFDLGYTIFLRATLTGVVLDAARESTLETAPNAQNTIDASVTRRIREINSAANVSFDRKNYFDFTDVRRSEIITNDINGDGVCDPGESFQDENGNFTWDADVGQSGIGGAQDVVLYTVNVNYDRLFPFYNFIGASQNATMSYSTILRNQPYGGQVQNTTTQVATC